MIVLRMREKVRILRPGVNPEDWNESENDAQLARSGGAPQVRLADRVRPRARRPARGRARAWSVAHHGDARPARLGRARERRGTVADTLTRDDQRFSVLARRIAREHQAGNRGRARPLRREAAAARGTCGHPTLGDPHDEVSRRSSPPRRRTVTAARTADVNPRPPLRLLADTEWLREPPPPQLVDGLLPAGALAALVGAPGTGKTFVAMSLSTAIGIAADWLGHRITAAGPVIYAVGEGHTAFPRRLRAVRTAHGLQEDEPSGVFYGREPLSLLDSSDVTCLLDSVREHLQGEAPRLLVFDPLAAFMGGGDENSTQDMSTVVASLNRIRTDTDAAVLVT